jgi:hypothetical protein
MNSILSEVLRIVFGILATDTVRRLQEYFMDVFQANQPLIHAPFLINEATSGLQYGWIMGYNSCQAVS